MQPHLRLDTDARLITAAGESDQSTAPDLLAVLRAAHRLQPSVLMCDTCGGTFCSAAGIGAFIRARNELHADDAGPHLVNVSKSVSRLLDIAGLTATLEPVSRSEHVA